MNRLAQKLSLAGWGLSALARHGWPRALTHFAAGVGDELMLTAVIRALRERGAPPFWVMSRRAELYGGNPDVAAVVPVDPRMLALARRCRAHIVEPRYALATGTDGNLHPPPAHMITCLMATAGVTGAVHLRPVLYLTNAERQAAMKWSDCVVIQSSVRSAVRPNELKEWWPDRWQSVVDALRADHRIIQVGGEHDPRLQGAEDLRGHGLNLRGAAAILSQARLFVGLESGFMHLARAVDCPAVILFGGRVHPTQAGYAGFTNLTRTPACSPCWRYTGCELDRQCMREISADEVIASVRSALVQPRGPLPTMTVDLNPAEAQRIRSLLAV